MAGEGGLNSETVSTSEISTNTHLSSFDQQLRNLEPHLEKYVKSPYEQDEKYPSGVPNELHRIANIAVARIDFNLDGKTTEDTQLQTINNLAKKYFPQFALNVEGTIREKQRMMDLLQPGKFLAHGGYSQDIKAIIESGGLRSSWSRINNGFLSPDNVPRWKNSIRGQPDAGAVYFLPWEGEGSAGAYSMPTGDKKGITDMAFIYPSEEIVKNAKALVKLPYSEIAATGSNQVFESGKFKDTSDDDLVISLDNAFIVIFGKPKGDSVNQTFLEHGYTQNWIENHIKVFPSLNEITPNLREPDTTLGWDLGGGANVEANSFFEIRSYKPEIDAWLKEKHQSSEQSVTLETRLIDPNTDHAYPGNVYSAKLTPKAA